MRLWSLHPAYLDAKGLVALWREALLAQKVLRGRTKGYRHHPQLQRFNEAKDPIAAIGTYLQYVYDESLQRGYRFDADKIGDVNRRIKIRVTSGQIAYETQHLLKKLRARDRGRYHSFKTIDEPAAHPLFRPVDGSIADWEITS